MNWESSQNEKRKKWEESKETAFRKGKGKKNKPAGWEQWSQVISFRPEGSGTRDFNLATGCGGGKVGRGSAENAAL